MAVSARGFTPLALVPRYSGAVLKRIYPFASRMMSVSILAIIHMQIDKLIVSKFLPIGLFGYYSFAYSTVAKGTMVAGAISEAAFPSFSELYGVGDLRKLMSEYWKVQNFACLALVPVYGAIPFASLPLFSYLFDPETANMLFLPVTLLTIGFYMNGTLTVSSVLSQAMGKPGIIVRLNIYAMVVVLPGAVLLIHFFGLSGAGFSWILYHFVSYAYAVPRICAECLGCSSWKWLGRVIRIFLLAGITNGTGWMVLNSFASFTVAWSLFGYLASSALFLGTSSLLLRGGLREALSHSPAGSWTKALLRS